MYYVRWTENEISGLESLGITVLLAEIDAEGRVWREIGLNARKEIVFRSPTSDRHYGLFDNQLVGPGKLHNDVTDEEFEALWALGEGEG